MTEPNLYTEVTRVARLAKFDDADVERLYDRMMKGHENDIERHRSVVRDFAGLNHAEDLNVLFKEYFPDSPIFKYYVGWKGDHYYCESKDRYGYNMRNISNINDDREVTNVSGRAIGGSYHEIYFDSLFPKGVFTSLGGWTGQERFLEEKAVFEANGKKLPVSTGE